MNMTPVVGLAAHTERLGGVEHQAVRDVYLRALADVAGCTAVVLPVCLDWTPADAAVMLGRLDGLVLGGHESNVEAGHYGGRPSADELHEPRRDRFALQVVPLAVRAGIPLLGICRGLQEMNVALGGSLRTLPPDGEIVHREDCRRPRDEQYLARHDIALPAGGLLRALLGRPRARTNSLHEQAVGVLSPQLRCEARSPDGVVEAASVTRSTAFALGVQWHPEWYAAGDPLSRTIFEAFGAACRHRAAIRSGSVQVPARTHRPVEEDPRVHHTG